MKKLLALLFVASLGLAVVGCGSKAADDAAAPASGIKDKTPKTADE